MPAATDSETSAEQQLSKFSDEIQTNFRHDFSVVPYDGLLVCLPRTAFKKWSDATSLMFDAGRIGQDRGTVNIEAIDLGKGLLPKYATTLHPTSGATTFCGKKFLPRAIILHGMKAVDKTDEKSFERTHGNNQGKEKTNVSRDDTDRQNKNLFDLDQFTTQTMEHLRESIIEGVDFEEHPSLHLYAPGAFVCDTVSAKSLTCVHELFCEHFPEANPDESVLIVVMTIRAALEFGAYGAVRQVTGKEKITEDMMQKANMAMSQLHVFDEAYDVDVPEGILSECRARCKWLVLPQNDMLMTKPAGSNEGQSWLFQNMNEVGSAEFLRLNKFHVKEQLKTLPADPFIWSLAANAAFTYLMPTLLPTFTFKLPELTYLTCNSTKALIACLSAAWQLVQPLEWNVRLHESMKRAETHCMRKIKYNGVSMPAMRVRHVLNATPTVAFGPDKKCDFPLGVRTNAYIAAHSRLPKRTTDTEEESDIREEEDVTLRVKHVMERGIQELYQLCEGRHHVMHVDRYVSLPSNKKGKYRVKPVCGVLLRNRAVTATQNMFIRLGMDPGLFARHVIYNALYLCNGDPTRGKGAKNCTKDECLACEGDPNFCLDNLIVGALTKNSVATDREAIQAAICGNTSHKRDQRVFLGDLDSLKQGVTNIGMISTKMVMTLEEGNVYPNEANTICGDMYLYDSGRYDGFKRKKAGEENDKNEDDGENVKKGDVSSNRGGQTATEGKQQQTMANVGGIDGDYMAMLEKKKMSVPFTEIINRVFLELGEERTFSRLGYQALGTGELPELREKWADMIKQSKAWDAFRMPNLAVNKISEMEKLLCACVSKENNCWYTLQEAMEKMDKEIRPLYEGEQGFVPPCTDSAQELHVDDRARTRKDIADMLDAVDDEDMSKEENDTKAPGVESARALIYAAVCEKAADRVRTVFGLEGYRKNQEQQKQQQARLTKFIQENPPSVTDIERVLEDVWPSVARVCVERVCGAFDAVYKKLSALLKAPPGDPEDCIDNRYADFKSPSPDKVPKRRMPLHIDTENSGHVLNMGYSKTVYSILHTIANGKREAKNDNSIIGENRTDLMTNRLQGTHCKIINILDLNAPHISVDGGKMRLHEKDFSQVSGTMYLPMKGKVEMDVFRTGSGWMAESPPIDACSNEDGVDYFRIDRPLSGLNPAQLLERLRENTVKFGSSFDFVSSTGLDKAVDFVRTFSNEKRQGIVSRVVNMFTSVRSLDVLRHCDNMMKKVGLKEEQDQPTEQPPRKRLRVSRDVMKLLAGLRPNGKIDRQVRQPGHRRGGVTVSESETAFYDAVGKDRRLMGALYILGLGHELYLGTGESAPFLGSLQADGIACFVLVYTVLRYHVGKEMTSGTGPSTGGGAAKTSSETTWATGQIKPFYNTHLMHDGSPTTNILPMRRSGTLLHTTLGEVCTYKVKLNVNLLSMVRAGAKFSQGLAPLAMAMNGNGSLAAGKDQEYSQMITKSLASDSPNRMFMARGPNVINMVHSLTPIQMAKKIAEDEISDDDKVELVDIYVTNLPRDEETDMPIWTTESMGQAVGHAHGSQELPEILYNTLVEPHLLSLFMKALQKSIEDYRESKLEMDCNHGDDDDNDDEGVGESD